jgi:hypothetical protein
VIERLELSLRQLFLMALTGQVSSRRILVAINRMLYTKLIYRKTLLYKISCNINGGSS